MSAKSKLGTITRRTFLIGSVAIAGGAAFGYWKYKQPWDNPLERDLADGEAALTPFVLIDQQGVSIIAPRTEMGQGTHTTLAALVAEELEVDLNQVKVLHGPASGAYFNTAMLEEGVPFPATDNSGMANNVREFMDVPAKLLGLQATGGSSSIPDAYVKMRTAGAAARHALLHAAAGRLGIAVEELSAKDGQIVGPNGDKLSYADLAVDASKIELPEQPSLKYPANWQQLGKSLPRIDIVGKSTGTAKFGIDVDLPNMLFATIKQNPHLGSAMQSFDASKAESMPGVKKIFAVDNGVAVVATNTWYAFKAADAISFDWAEASYSASSEELFKEVAASFADEYQDSQFVDEGDVESALEASVETISAEYRAPLLAHAALEPISATALLKDGKLDVWAGNQMPTISLRDAAKVSGLEEDQVSIHSMLLGGSFGRRLEGDFITQIVKIAMAMEGTPVKMTWTREEDMTHDFYRPLAMARFTASADKDQPLAVDMQLACPSPTAGQLGRAGIPVAGPDLAIVNGAWDQPYAIPHRRVTGYRTQTTVPVSFWRSVGASQNGFFHDSMIDEIAHARGLDPMQMRIDNMAHEPSRKVLEAVAEMSDWGSALPEGHGRGVAYTLSFGVPVAEVIEVAQQDNGIKILKAYIAADVGVALDPKNIEAQLFGGLNYGLAAAMSGEITFKDGKVEQTNFHNYKSIRMNQAPEVEMKILQNGDKIRGIGEPATPPAAPALANAIFAATGQRIRELPLEKHVKFA